MSNRSDRVGTQSHGPDLPEATQPRETLLIAHRGLSGPEPENSLEAFRASLGRGVRAFEFDVRKTKDDVLVVCHDSEVSGRAVSASLAAELAPQGIAPLRDVLEALADAPVLDIELKEPGYEERFVRETLGMVSADHLLVTSFHDETLARIKALQPSIRTGLLLGLETPQHPVRVGMKDLFPLRRLRGCRADIVAPHWSLLRSGFLQRMKAAGYPVFVWTVSSEDRLRRYLGNPNIAAIITNEPVLARLLRDERLQRG